MTILYTNLEFSYRQSHYHYSNKRNEKDFFFPDLVSFITKYDFII